MSLGKIWASVVYARNARKHVENSARNLSTRLEEIPRDKWPKGVSRTVTTPSKIFRSKDFLVQVFRVSPAVMRLTVNRTVVLGWNPRGGPAYAEGITWDELQAIKSELGYGHRDAVEVFPKDADVVNVANMRHLFVLSEGHSLDFIWRKKG